MNLSIPYELRIGIAEAGNLDDGPEVRDAINRVVHYLSTKLIARNNATPLKWVAVSSFKTSAEQFLAREILDKNGSVEIVVPVEFAAFGNSISDIKTRNGWDSLRTHPRAIVAEVPCTPERHESAYYDCDEEIVDRCEFFIAIWDGKQTPSAVGADKIALYAVEAGKKVIWIQPALLGEPAQWLELASEHQRETFKMHGVGIVARDLPANRPNISRDFVHLTIYNRKVTEENPRLLRELAEQSQKLRLIAADSKLPEEWLKPLLEHGLPLLVKADIIAGDYNLRYRLTLRALFYGAAVAVSIAAAQLIFAPQRPHFLFIEVGLMIGSLLLLWWSRRSFWHDRAGVARYIAEILRIIVLTLPVNSTQILPRLRPSRKTRLFRVADNELLPSLWGALTSARKEYADLRSVGQPDISALGSFLSKVWLKNQIHFHHLNTHRQHRAAHRSEWLVSTMFALTLVCALFHALLRPHVESATALPVSLQESHNWVALVAIIAPAWAAAIHGLAGMRAYVHQAERSRAIELHLRYLDSKLETAEELQTLSQLASEAADVMTSDIQDWLVQLALRPPGPVA
jgi:hypothetical protein